MVSGTFQLFNKLDEGLINNIVRSTTQSTKYHEISLNPDFFKIEIFYKSSLTNWLKVIPSIPLIDRTRLSIRKIWPIKQKTHNTQTNDKFFIFLLFALEKKHIYHTQTCLFSGECPPIDDDKKCPPPEELSNEYLLDADCDEKFRCCSDGCQLGCSEVKQSTPIKILLVNWVSKKDRKVERDWEIPPSWSSFLKIVKKSFSIKKY